MHLRDLVPEVIVILGLARSSGRKRTSLLRRCHIAYLRSLSWRHLLRLLLYGLTHGWILKLRLLDRWLLKLLLLHGKLLLGSLVKRVLLVRLLMHLLTLLLRR